jgi:thiol:disulfide interchange protein
LLTSAISAVALSCSSPSSTTAPPTVAITRTDLAPAERAAGKLRPEQGAEPLSRAGELPSGAPRTATVIAWELDERDARERARRRGLPQIVYLRADWSASSLEMERTTWSDPRVGVASRRFIVLKLDVSSAEGDAELYAERYGVERIPSTLVVDTDGRTVAVLGGAVSADALLAAMRRALE